MFKSCFLKKRNDFDCIKRLCCLSSANNDWSNESVLYIPMACSLVLWASLT